MTQIRFTRNGLNCTFYPHCSTLVTTPNGTADRAFEPQARKYDLTLEQHRALVGQLEADPMAPNYEQLTQDAGGEPEWMQAEAPAIQ